MSAYRGLDVYRVPDRPEIQRPSIIGPSRLRPVLIDARDHLRDRKHRFRDQASARQFGAAISIGAFVGCFIALACGWANWRLCVIGLVAFASTGAWLTIIALRAWVEHARLDGLHAAVSQAAELLAMDDTVTLAERTAHLTRAMALYRDAQRALGCVWFTDTDGDPNVP